MADKPSATPNARSHAVSDLSGLINTILGFGTAIAKDRLQRSELVIKLLKSLGLDPDHPPADFTAVYQYALVEYGVGKPKPVLDIFRQVEIQQIFRRALDQNNPAILLKEGEAFLADHALGDELQALGLNAQRELYGFAAVFLEIAKRTRTPAEVLTNQRLDSLHRQLGTMQERLKRLPTLEGIRTEMARLAEQGVPAASESSAAQQCRAFALAQQMRGWFETLGYRFELAEVWADDYFEWILNIPVRRNRFDRILVRGIAGEAGLRDVLALGQSVAAQRTDEGWLVTARRISRAARDAVELPENRHLDCYTFDELVDLDADFSGYIAWLEAEILRRGVATQYVPLACAKEELDPVTKQRVTVSRYDERDGWIDGYCDRWLDDSTKEHISVLGEFGTGKTWFAFHYAQVALQRYQEAKERGTQRPRLPLVITLRDYAKALNVENVLAGFFFTQHNIRLNSEVFDQLNRMGKLLLIFDGFDEMAAKVDRQQMINNFWELAKVVVPGAKVILTCRTEHFPEAQDGRALLNAELQASTANLTGETPQFEVLELEKFTDEQIRQVLALQATAVTVEQVMGNPQLLDLARRPVMTELILEALPDIEAGKPVDMSRVYLYAVRRKMERDIKAERTFTSLADKLYFMCELSWEMLSTDQMSLNYREFPDRIRKLFGAMVQEEKDLDHWHYDMMGQTMLIRNADGDYTPAHRSLLEFFVAYKFAAELGALAPDFLELAQMRSDVGASLPAREYTWSEYFGNRTEIIRLAGFSSESLERLRTAFGQSILTKAILDLLIPMLAPEDLAIEKLIWILKRTKNRGKSDVGYIGGNIATLLMRLDRDSLKGNDCSHTVICNADFSDAHLHDVDLSYADLTESLFRQSFGMLISVEFSPDGSALAIGEVNGTVWLYSISKNKFLMRCQGHTHGIRSLAFSPNGQMLASGSNDCTVRLWEINTGRCTATYQGHTKNIWSVSFNPDGEILSSGSGDHTVKLWKVETGECIATLEGHINGVLSAAFSPDGKLIVSGSEDQTIKLWKVETGECLATLRGHENGITSVAFDLRGQLIASGSRDHTIKLWSSSTTQCIRTLKGHIRQVRSIAFSPDGQILISGSNDQTIKKWHVQSGQCITTFRGHTTWVLTVAFSPDGKNIASASNDQTVRLWDVSTGSCIKTLQGHCNHLQSLEFSPDGNLLATGSTDQLIRLWQISSGQCIRTLKTGNSWIYSLSFSPDGKLLASSSLDPFIYLWQTATGQCIQTLKGHTDSVMLLAFSPDGQILASQDRNKTVKIWHIQTGECLNTYEKINNILLSVDSDGKIVINDYLHKEIELSQSINAQRLELPNKAQDNKFQLIKNHDEKNLVAIGSSKNIEIWNIGSEKCIRVLRLPKAYEGMNITGVKGLTEAEKATLKALGAVEDSSSIND
jgi:predicted NACHT family NTPase